jgi:hypothetical protein
MRSDDDRLSWIWSFVRWDDSANSTDRQRHAKNAAEQRHDKTLRQHLTDDAAATGTDRKAQRDFPGTAGATHEKQICHVRARDEQHKHHCAGKNPNRGSHVADKYIANRLKRDAELIVGAWVSLRQPGRDPLHLRAGLCDADTCREPSDRDHIAARASLGGFGIISIGLTPTRRPNARASSRDSR